MNRKLLPILGIILFVSVALISWVVGMYNGLVTGQAKVENQWAQVENQYQRRFDLIPNLVESVKGSMKQEQAVFGAIAEARTRYAGATTVSEKAQAASQTESALSRLLVVMENYPELKSNENVQTLMTQLEGTENRVAVERGRYNDTVTEYNLLTRRFPQVFFAKLFGFKEAVLFKAVENANVAPKVQL